MTTKVSVIMGSKSDFAVMKNACDILDKFDVEYETKIVSAHRTPKRLYEFCESVEGRGIKIIIAGAGGAAHLPGMTASMTAIPVIGVPVESTTLKGIDSLLSIAQMPAGIPVASMAVGIPGAKNAGLMAIAMLAMSDERLFKKLKNFREKQTSEIALTPDASNNFFARSYPCEEYFTKQIV